MLTILSVGEDFDLLRTRAEILRKTGANVLSSSGAAALKFMAEWEFDIIVLGHSVGRQDAKQITEAAHRPESKTLILLLVCAETQEQTYEGLTIDGRSFVDPDCLIRSVAQLFESSLNTRAAETALMRSTSPSLAKKKPISLPADISARRTQFARFESRRAG